MNKNLLRNGVAATVAGSSGQRLVRLRSRWDSTRAERSSISSDGLAHSGSNLVATVVDCAPDHPSQPRECDRSGECS